MITGEYLDETAAFQGQVADHLLNGDNLAALQISLSAIEAAGNSPYSASVACTTAARCYELNGNLDAAVDLTRLGINIIRPAFYATRSNGEDWQSRERLQYSLSITYLGSLAGAQAKVLEQQSTEGQPDNSTGTQLERAQALRERLYLLGRQIHAGADLASSQP